jgi:GNAT superfamily N-acetyltransferase
MLHEAYAPLAEQGMRFVASHQNSDTTRKVRPSTIDPTSQARPSHQNRGIGSTLLRLVEGRARALGVVELALNTSERATLLINLYLSKGYRFIEHVQWSETNYGSVILAKRLR